MSRVRQLQTPQASTQEQDPIEQAAQKALTTLAGMLFEAEDEGEALTSRKDFQSIMTGTTGALTKPQDRSRVMLHLSQTVDQQTRGEFGQAADELQRALDIGLDDPAGY